MTFRQANRTANRILQIFALDDLYDEDGYPSGIASRCRTG